MSDLSARLSGVLLKQTIACILLLLFAVDLAAQPSTTTPKDQVEKLAPNSYLEVRLNDKSKLHGYLSTVEPDAFTIKLNDQPNPPTRRLAYTDVRSVKATTKTHTPVGAWIGVGVIAAVVVIVIAAVAIEHHNE